MFPMLEVLDLKVSYGRNLVIKGLALEIESGEQVCLLGGNGSGKSTLLKTISGLVLAQEGTVRFEGGVITDLPSHIRYKRGIALVPQDRKLFRQRTVRENLELGALSMNLPSAIVRERLEETLAMLPRLKEALDRPTGVMSGGEQQIVALGRALMAKPRLLLMDEPSAGLAPIWIDRLFDTLSSILSRYKLTLLIVEQNVSIGLALTSRALILQNGVIALAGASKELIHDERVIRSYLG